ncbi:uncharacterized protein [Mytilus edulis]|uniref:uncharacterized protein n=1 Tax=Mytilus edulis TaxID=6550 RepID=UPI0039F14B1A
MGIVPGVTCAADQCVTHASCNTSSKCQCETGYTATPTVKPTMCSGVIEVATLSYMLVIPIFDLIAQFVGIWMVFVINIAEGVEGVAYGKDCSSATCDDTHNICDTGKTNVCICDTGFFRKTSAAECAARFALNKVCEAAQTASDQCSIANSEYRDALGTDKCLCKHTHYETGGVCVLKIALKAACTDGHPADQCEDTLAGCRDESGFKCLCKTNNFENKDVTCAAQVGLDGTCDTTDSAKDQCSVVDTECRDDGTEKFAGLDTTCNGAVSATDQCSAADTECRDDGAGSKCLCIDTHYLDGSACKTKIALKAACTDGPPVDQCRDTLAECRDESGFKCLCKTNNFENKDVTCAARKIF